METETTKKMKSLIHFPQNNNAAKIKIHLFKKYFHIKKKYPIDFFSFLTKYKFHYPVRTIILCNKYYFVHLFSFFIINDFFHLLSKTLNIQKSDQYYRSEHELKPTLLVLSCSLNWKLLYSSSKCILTVNLAMICRFCFVFLCYGHTRRNRQFTLSDFIIQTNTLPIKLILNQTVGKSREYTYIYMINMSC